MCIHAYEYTYMHTSMHACVLHIYICLYIHTFHNLKLHAYNIIKLTIAVRIDNLCCSMTTNQTILDNPLYELNSFMLCHVETVTGLVLQL